MKTYKTHAFSVNIPHIFTLEKYTPINIHAIQQTQNSSIQNPSIRILLQPLEIYADYTGATLETKFHKLNLDTRFKAQTFCTFQTQEEGRKNYIHFTKTDTTFKDTEIKVNTLFIMSPINEKYALEMICDSPSIHWDSNLVLFESVWKSLKFDATLSNCDKAMQLYEQHVNSILNKVLT